MSAYYSSTVTNFLATPTTEVLAKLTLAYAADGFAAMHSETPVTWWEDLHQLRTALMDMVSIHAHAGDWFVLLEFVIPRKESRIDVVLLAGSQIIVLECKTGRPAAEALRQAETYALLLHYFHKGSDRLHLQPIVVSSATEALLPWPDELEQLRQTELSFEALATFWIGKTVVASWKGLPSILTAIDTGGGQIDGAAWDSAVYHATPSILEAAMSLRTGLSIREIAHSEASEHEVHQVVEEIRTIVDFARREARKVICFVTGVPGSGKTLVGLSLAHLEESRDGARPKNAIHFMSGNGPLVSVLQELFRREAMRRGVNAVHAGIQAKTLIENVHVFAKQYTERDKDLPPSNHVIIFDEAQRAWNRAQNVAKFKREYSEPEMLLRIMERHRDWACVIALVGGGQEINSGEAGLAEWGKAIAESAEVWEIYASPEVRRGGASTAGQRLFEGDGGEGLQVHQRETLHLRTSNRSLRAEKLAIWVNLLLAGDADGAAALRITERFPIFLTRSLPTMRVALERQSVGESRFGLVGSAGAARLRAEGLEPSSSFHAEYPWHNWYLSPRGDVRSSFRCEVFATEFEVQGLELDWVGVCWGGDFVWTGSEWEARALRHGNAARWSPVRSVEKQRYRRNAYRVLLTRARQGMMLFVPAGDAGDSTRSPQDFDRCAEFLMRCGVQEA